MTHQAHPSVTREVVQVLAEHGFDGMAEAMELLINDCMKIERQQAHSVGPYQRGDARQGQANGSSPGDSRHRASANCDWLCRRSEGRSSIPARWSAARAVRRRSAWPWPRCMCKACPRAR